MCEINWVIRIKASEELPVPIAGSNFQVQAEAVILATGEAIDFKQFSELLDTEQQLIKVNELSQSSVSKIFAGGDIVHTKRTVVDAIRSGKQAAIGIDCYLKGRNEKDILSLLHSIATNDQGGLSFKKYLDKDLSMAGKPVIGYEDLNISYFEHLARNERRELPVESRISNFKEVRAKLTGEAAAGEAESCFSCGLCNSCGNCFVLCPDGLRHL